MINKFNVYTPPQNTSNTWGESSVQKINQKVIVIFPNTTPSCIWKINRQPFHLIFIPIALLSELIVSKREREEGEEEEER